MEDIKRAIVKPIEAELEAFKCYYSGLFHSDIPLLDSTLKHVGDSMGKLMRPMLLLLSAKSVGEINDSTFAAAASLELLHTASLLHDDVVDESNMRRGRQSLNALYSNRIAILTGDFLFSSSLYNASLTMNPAIVQGLSVLGRTLSSGEMHQLELQRSGAYSEDNYISVISKKTASLFACCSRFGSLSVDADKDITEKLERFGEILGICFQIRDDIFDYFSSDIGKPTGNDIREGKITLPLLYVLNNTSDPTLVAVNGKLKKSLSLEEGEIALLIEAAKTYGGIDYAWRVIEQYKSEALYLIKGIGIPDECRKGLEAYLEYVISRQI